jgi:hypothetical protein
LKKRGLTASQPCKSPEEDDVRETLSYQHFHARKDLFTRLLGSFAVFALVSFFFNPVILAQKDFFRAPPSG